VAAAPQAAITNGAGCRGKGLERLEGMEGMIGVVGVERATWRVERGKDSVKTLQIFLAVVSALVAWM
jgi:hypothetical protein